MSCSFTPPAPLASLARRSTGLVSSNHQSSTHSILHVQTGEHEENCPSSQQTSCRQRDKSTIHIGQLPTRSPRSSTPNLARRPFCNSIRASTVQSRQSRPSRRVSDTLCRARAQGKKPERKSKARRGRGRYIQDAGFGVKRQNRIHAGCGDLLSLEPLKRFLAAIGFEAVLGCFRLTD